MRIKISLLGIILVLASCQKPPEVLPLDQDKLVLILADLHIAEAAFQNLTSSSKDTLAYNYYDQIYQIHETSEFLVDSSLAIMHRNPKLFYEVYENVRAHLEQKALESTKQRSK